MLSTVDNLNANALVQYLMQATLFDSLMLVRAPLRPPPCAPAFPFPF